MRLRNILILFVIFISGCNEDPYAPVVPRCQLVAVEGLEPYLYCLKSDGSGEPTRIPILQSNKYICTTPEGDVAIAKYHKELLQYINQNCNGGN